LSSCSAGTYTFSFKVKCQTNFASGLVSGYSAGMAARGSVGPAHAGRRKRSVARFRSIARSPSPAWALPRAPVVSIRFPGAGKSALSCACTRRTSFASHFAHLALKSRRNNPPRAVSRVSRRSLLLLALAAQRSRSRLAGASSRGTSSRAPRTLRHVGAVRQTDMEMVSKSWRLRQRLLCAKRRWQRAARTPRLKTCRIRSLALVPERAANKNRSRSRRRLPCQMRTEKENMITREEKRKTRYRGTSS
jgi:hypothetical protein